MAENEMVKRRKGIAAQSKQIERACLVLCLSGVIPLFGVMAMNRIVD